jgi:S-DNA-T family DNA segregation ATPase FtsK/SpoIIIE
VQARITVEDKGVRREFLVDTDEHIPVAQIAGALERPGVAGVWINGRRVALTEPVGTSGLGPGAVIAFTDPGPPRPVLTAADTELRIIGGAGTGLSWRVRDEAATVGSAPDVTVRIDDPDCAGTHFLVAAMTGGIALEPVAPARVAVDGKEVTRRVTASPGSSIQAGATFFELAAGTSRPLSTVLEGQGIRVLNIGPDNRLEFRSEALSSPSVPPSPKRRASKLLPLAPMLPMLAYALRGDRWTLAIGIASPAIYYGMSRRQQRLAESDDAKTWVRYVQERTAVVERLERAVAEEAAWRRIAFPGAADVAYESAGPTQWLWLRRPSRPRFLNLRIGMWTRPAETAIRSTGTGDSDTTVDLPPGPITVDLAMAGGLGICGDPARAEALARSVILQLAGLHAPNDVAIVFVGVDADEASWSWIRHLPHVQPDALTLALEIAPADDDNNELGPDDIFVGADLSSARKLDRALGRLEVRRRAANDDAAPAVVLVVLEPSRMSAALPNLRRLLETGHDIGIYGVSIARQQQDLVFGPDLRPVDGGHPNQVQLWSPKEQLDAIGEFVPVAVADRVARSLAPLRTLGATHGHEGLPLTIAFFELMGWRQPPTAAAIRAQWERTPPTAAVPIGVSAGGDRRRFALNDESSHALVGGTTGAGKSELLRTIITSFVVHLPPDRLNLLLVDYKGGLAFGALRGLPHVAGVVDNLTPALVRRAIDALDAEQRRRTRLYEKLGADARGRGINTQSPASLPEYWALCERLGQPSEIAKLVIVVDEFAELVRESRQQSDGALLASLVKVAAQGRAYGMHLVLATQDPSTAITDDILKNTQVRIALKVVDRHASQAIIESPEASLLPRWARGRAYLWLDHHAEPFQTSYVSGAADEKSLSAPRVVEHRWPDVNARFQREARTTELTQLAAIVRAVGEAGEGIPRPAPLFAEPLPRPMTFDELRTRPEITDHLPDGSVVVGLEDVPQRQRIEPFAIDPKAAGHVLFAGKRESGRTGFLRTVAVAATRSSPGAEVHVIGSPQEFEDLRAKGCVDTVIDSSDTLGIGLLLRQIAAVADRGAARGRTRTILLLVDELDRILLRDRREAQQELTGANGRVGTIFRDGPRGNVHVVATTTDVIDSAGVSFGLTIVGPHEKAHAADFVRDRAQVAALAGPGAALIVRQDGTTSLVTIAEVKDAPKSRRARGTATVRVASLPASVRPDEFDQTLPPSRDVVVIGARVTEGGEPLSDPVGARVTFGPGHRAALFVLGGPKSGKTNALALIGRRLALAERRLIVVPGRDRQGSRSLTSGIGQLPEGSVTMTAEGELPAGTPEDAAILIDDLPPRFSASSPLGDRIAAILAGTAGAPVVVSAGGDLPGWLDDLLVLERDRALLLGPVSKLSYALRLAFEPPYPSFAPPGAGGIGLLVCDGLADPVRLPLVTASEARE